MAFFLRVQQLLIVGDLLTEGEGEGEGVLLEGVDMVSKTVCMSSEHCNPIWNRIISCRSQTCEAFHISDGHSGLSKA